MPISRLISPGMQNAPTKKAMRANSRSDRADLARFNLAQMAENNNELNDAAELYRYFYYELPSDPLSDVAKRRLDVLEKSSTVRSPSVPLRFKRSRSYTRTLD